MANGYTSPPVLPDEDAFAPGVVISAGAFEYILDGLNYGNAHVGAGPLWQQGWPDGLAAVTAAAETTVTPLVEAPLVSPRHTTLNVWVRMSGNGTTARVRSTTAGDVASFAGPVGAAALIGPETLTIADGGSGFDTIALSLEGTGAVACVVEQVIVEIAPLSSPLAAGLNGAAHGFGTGATANPDRAMTARRAAEIRETADALYERDRVQLTWAALLDAAVDGNGVPNLPADGLLVYNPATGRPRANAETTVRMLAEGVAGGDVAFDAATNSITVPAATASAWYTLTDTRSRSTGRIQSIDGRVVLQPTSAYDPEAGSVPDEADVLITSLSVRGP